MATRGVLFGKGINDANYVTQPTIDGSVVACQYYRKWKSMLERCYCPKYHKNRPTYIGCIVCDEWLSFMAFRAWMITQPHQGNHLDKDLILAGNKIYGPDTCVFVSTRINSLLSDHGAARGKYLIGVSLDGHRFKAQCNINGKSKNIGRYRTQEAAHNAWRLAKAGEIKRTVAEEENLDHIVKQSLLATARQLEDL